MTRQSSYDLDRAVLRATDGMDTFIVGDARLGTPLCAECGPRTGRTMLGAFRGKRAAGDALLCAVCRLERAGLGLQTNAGDQGRDQEATL